MISLTKAAVSARGILCGAMIAISGVAVGTPGTGHLYFTDLFYPDFSTGHLNRMNTNGSGLTELVNTGGGIRGLDVDAAGGKMYWADVNDFTIRRANLDGSGQEIIVQLTGSGEDVPFPSAVALHKQDGKVYWGDQLLGTVSRANLDGSNPQVLFSTPFHRGLAIDSVNRKIYWSTSITMFKGEILRSNLDGSGREVVVSSLDSEFKPNKIALDVSRGKIYWTDYVVDVVRRSNLNGTGMETLFVPPFNRNPQGISLDLRAGLVYWGQDIEIDGHTGKIMVMNLDGSNPRDLRYGFGHVAEVKFVPLLSTARPRVIGR